MNRVIEGRDVLNLGKRNRERASETGVGTARRPFKEHLKRRGMIIRNLINFPRDFATNSHLLWDRMQLPMGAGWRLPTLPEIFKVFFPEDS